MPSSFPFLRTDLSGPVRAGLWMTLSALFYAVSGSIVRHLSGELHTFQLVFMRDLFGLMFLAPWLYRSGWGALRTQRIGLHAVRGFASMVNVTCQFGALAYIAVADMAAISFLQPVFGSIIAIMALGEALSGRRWTAVLIGFTGAMVMLRPGFQEINIGVVLALGSALAGSMIAILIKYMLRTETADAVAFWLFIFQTLIALVPALFVWVWPSWEQLGWMVALGYISVSLQRTFNRAMAAADASVAMPFNFSRLIWAALLGWMVFGELPDMWTWIGGTIIFAASIYLARSERRAKRAVP